MSAIGRVFIVLNLILAGVFVGFSGTYLQHSTHWKTEHDTLSEKYQKETVALEEANRALQNQLNDQTRTNSNLDSLLKKAQADLTEQKAENEKLDKQLADIQGDIKQIHSNYATVASNLQRATEESARSMKMAMEASERENAAKDEKETAQQQLAEASAKITDLENKFAEQSGQLAKVSEEFGQNKALLDAWSQRFPGGREMLLPDLKGRIAKVHDDKLITLEITDKSADAKAGYKVAIYDNNKYKGEAVITDVLEGNMAFGTVTTRANGASIRVGDQFATNLAR